MRSRASFSSNMELTNIGQISSSRNSMSSIHTSSGNLSALEKQQYNEFQIRNQESSPTNASKTSVWMYWLSVTLIIGMIILIIYYLTTIGIKHDLFLVDVSSNANQLNSCSYYLNQKNTSSEISYSQVDVYILHTKLAGVSYEGGHWFHMAENFLTYHSILDQSESSFLPNNNNNNNNNNVNINNNTSTTMTRSLRKRHLVFMLDNPKFVDQMNAITRFIVVLGTVTLSSLSTNSFPTFVHFVSVKKEGWNKDDISDTLQKINQGKTIDLSDHVPTQNRFVETNPTSPSMIQKDSNCINFVGSFGGNWPTPQRGHWFPRGNLDVLSLRQKIAYLCPLSSIPYPSNSPIKRKLVIYQRDQSRKLENEKEAIELLKTFLPESSTWSIQVLMHKSSRSPCELSSLLHDVDVLITPHGFQSMLLLFLPRPSILFEIFPYKYYKRGYGPLSNEYGIIHVGIMSPPSSSLSQVILSRIQTTTCMSVKQCRNYARNHDVILSRRGIVQLIDTLNKYLPQFYSFLESESLIESSNKPILSLNQTLRVKCRVDSGTSSSNNSRNRTNRNFIYQCDELLPLS